VNKNQLEVAAELRAQLAAATDDDERERLRNDIAEYEGHTLTGDAHQRDDGGNGSP
jgi:hypothetical protein